MTATPVPTPTPSPTPTGSSSTAFTCPTNDTSIDGSARTAATGRVYRRPPSRAAVKTSPSTGLLAVTYNRSTVLANRTQIAAREANAGTSFVREFDFTHTGLVTRVLQVAPSQATSVAAVLRAQPGVRSVAAAGGRRYTSAVTAPGYITNDPYFQGFATTVPPVTGATTPPVTYSSPPYYQNSGVPGQWDMHAVKLEYAFAYSQTGNGSSVAVNAGALGSPSVKLAVIDTGEDSTHPELASKVLYQRCFITNAAGNAQSTSNFSTDPDGHGTDVSGIAAADTNNALGFAGDGGQISVYAYRVFPTPDDSCETNPSSSDPQCGADDVDIASALEDAVAQHVNVINLSLGGGGCTGGADDDPVEGDAIADAIAANIIVVAASGNSGGSPLQAPACDAGVIAAGATSLDDGVPNGSGTSVGGTAASPKEYVATYTTTGTTAAAPLLASAWGIVAPGGDPSSADVSGANTDVLHWIENIWTSTPFDGSEAGNCASDYPVESTTSGTPDCRVDIAGTSMASPHVAGAAALILSATGGSGSIYQSATAMKSLLCTTADDIGDAREGCGRLNVYRAMAVALGDTSPPPH
jgi:subtilisin family serine protease